MDTFLKLGRYLLAIPTAIFGLLNLIYADEKIGTVPHWLPGGVIWVYLIGVCLIAISIAIAINQKAKLAAALLALLMIVFVLTVYLPKLLAGDDTASIGLLKDLMIAGGAMILADNTKAD